MAARFNRAVQQCMGFCDCVGEEKGRLTQMLRWIMCSRWHRCQRLVPTSTDRRHLQDTGGCQGFSTLEMKSGYHQVKMAKQDKEKMAFSYDQELWQFKVMAFGLCSAPATFECFMERVLDGLYWKIALIYLNDMIIFGQTFRQELERLAEAFALLRAANLKLSPKKCSLLCYGNDWVQLAIIHLTPPPVASVTQGASPCFLP